MGVIKSAEIAARRVEEGFQKVERKIEDTVVTVHDALKHLKERAETEIENIEGVVKVYEKTFEAQGRKFVAKVESFAGWVRLEIAGVLTHSWEQHEHEIKLTEVQTYLDNLPLDSLPMEDFVAARTAAPEDDETEDETEDAPDETPPAGQGTGTEGNLPAPQETEVPASQAAEPVTTGVESGSQEPKVEEDQEKAGEGVSEQNQEAAASDPNRLTEV